MSTVNPIKPPLDNLFERLNDLYGLLSLLKSQLDNLRNLLNEIVEKRNLNLSDISEETSLVIRDLTEQPKNGWPIYYPSGQFVSRGEAYIRISDVLVNRESAWTISQGYEAFETFIKDVTTLFLYKDSQYADIEFWGKLIRQSRKKNVEILKLLGEVAPELKKFEQKNNRNIDLTKWYKVVSEVRHASVHSNMLIKHKAMSSWSGSDKKLLAGLFQGRYTDDGYLLEPTIKNARCNLTLFAEYAFLIFKCLSKLKNYNWEILQN